jgi:hypothetical protein
MGFLHDDRGILGSEKDFPLLAGEKGFREGRATEVAHISRI